MRNLISGGGMKHVKQYMPPCLFSTFGGILAKPHQGNHPMRAIELNAPWAADNGCYVKYDPAAIIRMLEKYRGIPNCLFVNAPDVVCNATATLFMFWIWQPIIYAYGYPVAFTLQNGITFDTVPWDYCDALFIGGDTKFKYSPLVAQIVKEAKRLGKWVHMGRVNSASRITYALSIGVDSFDGTGYSLNPSHIGRHLPFHSASKQPALFMEVA